jgi:AraC-like DNA-binding protein
MSGLRAARSESDFLQAPVGAYLQTRAFLVWCGSRSLCGTSLFDRPSERDAAALVRIWDGLRPTLRPPYDLVTDGRRLRAVDADGFRLLEAFLRRVAPLYATRVRRHALLHAAGLPGAVLAGSLPNVGTRHSWRVFTDVGAAFRWLPSASPELVREVETLVQEAQGAAPLLRALRGWLAGHVGEASLAAAARALGAAPRSLQRALGAAGTSFRAELARARVAAGERLLGETDAKVEAVAARVGFTSPSHFSRFFRRQTGRSPRDRRTR